MLFSKNTSGFIVLPLLAATLVLSLTILLSAISIQGQEKLLALQTRTARQEFALSTKGSQVFKNFLNGDLTLPQESENFTTTGEFLEGTLNTKIILSTQQKNHSNWTYEQMMRFRDNPNARFPQPSWERLDRGIPNFIECHRFVQSTSKWTKGSGLRSSRTCKKSELVINNSAKLFANLSFSKSTLSANSETSIIFIRGDLRGNELALEFHSKGKIIVVSLGDISISRLRVVGETAGAALLYSGTGQVTIDYNSPKVSLCSDPGEQGTKLSVLGNAGIKIKGSVRHEKAFGCPFSLPETLWPAALLIAESRKSKDP